MVTRRWLIIDLRNNLKFTIIWSNSHSVWSRAWKSEWGIEKRKSKSKLKFQTEAKLFFKNYDAESKAKAQAPRVMWKNWILSPNPVNKETSKPWNKSIDDSVKTKKNFCFPLNKKKKSRRKKLNELDCAPIWWRERIVLNKFHIPRDAFLPSLDSNKDSLVTFSLFIAIISNNIQLKFIAKDVSIQNVSTIHNLFDLIIFKKNEWENRRQKKRMKKALRVIWEEKNI